ncbi:unnamed protein product [Fusarium graminearum]|nr:unnamed protein product [Fusarium graminearum]
MGMVTSSSWNQGDFRAERQNRESEVRSRRSKRLKLRLRLSACDTTSLDWDDFWRPPGRKCQQGFDFDLARVCEDAAQRGDNDSTQRNATQRNATQRKATQSNAM